MTRHQKPSPGVGDFVEIKSQFGAEFRRFSVARLPPPRIEEFRALLLRLHGLAGMVRGASRASSASGGTAAPPAAGRDGRGGTRGGGGGELSVCYTVADGSLLPITNCFNFAKAISGAAPLLRLTVAITDDAHHHHHHPATGAILPATGSGAAAKRSVFSGLRSRGVLPRLAVGPPRDFHPLSSLIDVDVLPATLRRVRLYRHGSARPLGFYVADRADHRAGSISGAGCAVGVGGGVFISRLLPGGLAAASGLLSVGDRILEVNGAPVAGKGLDEVTAMMVANGHHLVVTVRPAGMERGSATAGGGGGVRRDDDDEFWPRDSGSSESSVQSLVSDGSEGMRLSRRGSQRRHHHHQQHQQKRSAVREEESLTSCRSGGDSDSLALAPLLSDAELWDSEDGDEEEEDDEDLVIDRTNVDHRAGCSAGGKGAEPGPARCEGGARGAMMPNRRSGTVTEEAGVITLYL